MKRIVIGVMCLLALMVIPIFMQACEEAAKFEVVSLDVHPSTVTSGEKVTVRAEIKNICKNLETYTVPLMVNGIADNRKSITLKPGATEVIEFSIARSAPGIYNIAIGERSSTFVVQKVIPAAFKVSDLEISPTTANVGERIVISAKVTNAGGTQGDYVAELKIDGSTIQVEKLTLLAGTDYTQIFGVCADFPGTYEVALAGLTGAFTVLQPVIPVDSNPYTTTPPQTSSYRKPPRC